MRLPSSVPAAVPYPDAPGRPDGGGLRRGDARLQLRACAMSVSCSSSAPGRHLPDWSTTHANPLRCVSWAPSVSQYAPRPPSLAG